MLFKELYNQGLQSYFSNKQKLWTMFDRIIYIKGLEYFIKASPEFLNGYLFGTYGYLLPDKILLGFRKWYLFQKHHL